MYGVGRLDDVAFVGDVHGLAFLWVKVMFRICGLLFGQCCAIRPYSSPKIDWEVCIIIYRVYIEPTDFRMSSDRGPANYLCRVTALLTICAVLQPC